MEMMEEKGVNVAEARAEFDKYWDGKEHFKGDGRKRFERWYITNKNRIDVDGNLISSTKVSNEYNKLKTTTKTQTGNWYCYGPIDVAPRTAGKKDGGRVRDVQFDPDDSNTYYVSCFKGGLFKTPNAGNTWTPLTDNITHQVYISQIDPDNTNVIYIGTNGGVLKTTNNGSSWNTTTITDDTRALLIKSDNNSVIIAGTKTGIYRSTDAGNSWTLVKSANRVEDIKQHPTNVNIMYAGTNDSPSNFFRSTDGGATWTEINDFGQGTFMKIAVTPAEPNYVYVINTRDYLGDDSFEGVYLSTNSGASFTKRSGGTPNIIGYKDDGSMSRGQCNYNLFIVADPTNANEIYAGGVKSWKSTDGGVTWTLSYYNVTEGNSLHLDQLNWAYNPHTNVLFACNDGGIYYLNPEGNFKMITDGLPIAEVYECSQSQTNQHNVMSGTMHCGYKLNYNGTWHTPGGGDEATCIIDYSDEDYVYHIKYEKVQRSTNGGFKMARLNPENTERGHYTGTGVLHKGNINTLFVGFQQVHRTQNARAENVSWEVISSFSGTTKIDKVEQSTANHDIIYVGRGSSLFRSDNANASNPTFTSLPGLPGSGSVVDIETHPTNDNIVYILRGQGIYKSTDKGSTWTNITLDLPSVGLDELKNDDSANEGLYVGTDIGIFYKDATMDSWVNFSNGLPLKRVAGIDIYYGATRDQSFITAALDGRGFWRSSLYGETTSVDDIEAEYLFNGNLNDNTGNGHDATNSNISFTSIDGIQVADFDGTAFAKVTGWDGILEGNARSVSAWIKTSTPEKTIAAWGKASVGSKWVFCLDDTGELRLEIGTGNVVGSTVLTDGQWHHVAVTLPNDGSPNVNEATLYVDGVAETPKSTTAYAVNTVADLDFTIGSDHISRNFVGQIDDLRIYNIALTAQEVADLSVFAGSGSVDYKYIKHNSSGSWLYADSNGNNPGISSADGDNIHWNLIDVGSGQYRLEHKGSGKWLYAFTDGTDLKLVAANSYSGDRTKWTFVDAGNGWYRLQHVSSGMWLHVKETGTQFELGPTSWTGNNTKWQFSDNKLPTTIPDNNIEGEGVLVYPNPSNGIINVSVPYSTKGDIDIQVINMDGKIIYEKTEVKLSNNFTSVINLNGQPNGIYIVKVVSDSRTSYLRIIIN
jgi:photosystem II stability/assembly factor-like uncharacterized protein